MKAIEYFIPRLNGWLKLSLDAYLSLLFTQEEKKFSKIKIPKGLPISILDSSSSTPTQEQMSFQPGNFVEVLIKQNLILENKEKGRIKISNDNNEQKEEKTYEIWTRGKIISNDTNSKILFVELNDQINIIDNMDLVRPLKEIKPTQNILVAYNLRQIASNEYNLMKGEFDKNLATNSNKTNKLLYIKYDVINGSLLFFGDKNDLNSLALLKQHEERYNKNNDEQNSISDFSNANSNNNLIGIGIKSPSGHSENSENKLIILDDEVKNEINDHKFNCFFTFRDKFRKDMQKSIGEVFQKCKYYVGKNNDNNFDIVLYGNNRDAFLEEKKIFENEYKQVKLENDKTVDIKEAKELAKKSNIKYIDFEKKNIYLVGKEQNINDFLAVWELNNEYSRDIQKISKENEIFQKELQSIKKKNKLK